MDACAGEPSQARGLEPCDILPQKSCWPESTFPQPCERGRRKPASTGLFPQLTFLHSLTRRHPQQLSGIKAIWKCTERRCIENILKCVERSHVI